ncbi:sugar kinase [Altererythrobacter lutimaris]|uniref:Sugar kinase n=1 Tax=Altererythrobacter lutimaris TaxID=2743979 RepID=A0A850H901_9SPHN|nr:sugar kinase [Altererythrobacter lutimaris]NVE94353.1 sugar kinase [Altererythrobacter lutimaris]
MNKVYVMGEALIELASIGDNTIRLGHGGDTLNTAVYLARLGVVPFFVSALGADSYSAGLRAKLQAENVAVDHVLTNRDKLPGLYAIDLDEKGERTFRYWRGDSAARTFFSLPGSAAAIEAMCDADWLVISGISLAVFNQEERDFILDAASKVRARGGEVVFDPNYRPQLWANPEQAISVNKDVAPISSIVLVTQADECDLHGNRTLQETGEWWHSAGANLIVMKRGIEGAAFWERGKELIAIPSQPDNCPVDTTGAGDSFNAAFLAALIGGASLSESARNGNNLARQVIRHQGALCPQDAMPSSCTSNAEAKNLAERWSSTP